MNCTELANVPGSSVSEAQVGGWWSIAVDVPEHGIVSYFWGKYTTVEPHTQLQHTMCYSQDAAEFTERNLDRAIAEVVVDFEQRGDKVWVRFAQYGQLPKEQIPLAQAGMESYFDSLANFLDNK